MGRSLLILCLSSLLLAAVCPAQRRTSLRPRATANAESPAWFPLTTGNYWIYEQEGADAARAGYRLDVGAAVTRGGLTYHELKNSLGPAFLVRHAGDGRFVAVDPGTDAEVLWYDFAAQDGVWWRIQGRDCLDRGRIAERGLNAGVPAGRFSAVIKVELRDPSCADAGATDELFVAGVGMIAQQEITIAGPRRLVLREARVDGKTIAAEVPAVRLSLALDKPVYAPNLMPPVDPGQAVPVLQAVLRIENTSGQPLRLDFASGQQFDAQIVGPSGDVLYTWSATRLFTQGATSMELDRDYREFVVEAALGSSGQPWPAGRYSLRAWLPVSDGPRYEAQMPFQIAEPVY